MTNDEYNYVVIQDRISEDFQVPLQKLLFPFIFERE